jgi:adenosylhomocysteine nucleosidase
VVLVDDTLVYDIIEQMGDAAGAIEHFHTRLDLSWLPQPYPHPVRVARLVSGDRDLLPEDIQRLQAEYGAVAGDWESGAIAWVAARNQLPCLILRGVTDLVSPQGGEAYGQLGLFQQRAAALMAQLVHQLPDWIAGVWENL